MGIADGKRALVIGVANDHSLAWSITQELHKQGAQIALTYQGEALKKRVAAAGGAGRRAHHRRAGCHRR